MHLNQHIWVFVLGAVGLGLFGAIVIAGNVSKLSERYFKEHKYG